MLQHSQVTPWLWIWRKNIEKRKNCKGYTEPSVSPTVSRKLYKKASVQVWYKSRIVQESYFNFIKITTEWIFIDEADAVDDDGM